MLKKIQLLSMVVIIASLMVMVVACGSKNDDTEETTETTAYDSSVPYDDVISNISYIDDGQTYHMLDLYGTQSVDKKTPVVIEVHGGAYIGGTKEANKDHCIFFARSGYVVVAPDYTKVREETDGTFKNAIQDLFAAYNWVADNADKYNFDLDNIYLSGDSAGGYYTLLSDAIMKTESLQEYFGVTKPSYDFTAYVTTCPGTDILALQEGLKTDEFVAKSIGVDKLNDTELMSHMDLYSNVDPEVFEGLYMMTSPDDATTGAEVQKFEAYLNENNVDHTLKTYEGTENKLMHVFNIIKPDFAESNQANHDMVDYMDSLLK